MIQVYGRKKCRITQRALRYFKERNIKVQNLDLDAHTLGGRELDLFIQAAGSVEKLIDRDGAAYQARGLSHLVFDGRDELLADPALLLTPVVRQGKAASVGENEAAWKEMVDREKT